jgi:hypothetical protein
LPLQLLLTHHSKSIFEQLKLWHNLCAILSNCMSVFVDAATTYISCHKYLSWI